MVLRKKAEAGDLQARCTGHAGEEQDELVTSSNCQPQLSPQTPQKMYSNRSFKPASAVLDSVRKKYRRLKDCLEDDGFSAEQFDQPATRVPHRAIALASFLLIAGAIALSLSLLTLSGHISFVPNEGPVVLLALGLLMFVPGAYHVRIAFYAFRECPGFSFDDIPDFE